MQQRRMKRILQKTNAQTMGAVDAGMNPIIKYQTTNQNGSAKDKKKEPRILGMIHKTIYAKTQNQPNISISRKMNMGIPATKYSKTNQNIASKETRSKILNTQNKVLNDEDKNNNPNAHKNDNSTEEAIKHSLLSLNKWKENNNVPTNVDHENPASLEKSSAPSSSPPLNQSLSSNDREENRILSPPALNESPPLN